MRAVELFAGAGGASLGLEQAGVEHAALCEWDADACATLRAAGMGPVVEGDVRDLAAIAAVAGESCDLLWSSFPCQAWSVAGSRRGAQDERNGWPWTVDAIDRFKPRWLLAENVRGLTFHTRKGGCGDPQRCPGCYLERVILADLRERFACAGYWVLNAANYGVPQRRQRVILWAGPVELTEPPATHRDPRKNADLFDDRKPWASMGEALGLTAGERVIGGGSNPREPGDAAARSYRDLTDEPSTTVAAAQIGNAGPWVLSLPSPTLIGGSTESHTCGRSIIRSQAVRDALPRRRLSVAECSILQDFPSDYPWQGVQTSQYRQVGNAVPPTMARVVAEAILRADPLA